jgi:hypothetical protein
MIYDYIKVNGVDQSDVIDSFQLTKSIDNSNSQLTVKKKFGTLLSWVNGQTVIIKMADGTILLYGKIRSAPKSDDLAQVTYTVQVDDLRQWYQIISVKEKFRKNMTVSDALKRLIQNYTSDYFGTDATDQTTYCPISVDCSLSEAIKQCLQLLEIQCVWRIRYDEGTNKIYHDFVQAFSTNIGDVDGVDLPSGLFQIDEDQIKNQIKVYSSDVLWPKPDIQYWYYDKNENINATEHTNRLKIALKRPLKSSQVYLLIGERSNDYGKRMKAVKMIWPKLVVTDSKDGGLIGFDPESLLAGALYVPPSLSYTGSSGVIGYDAVDMKATSAFTGQVAEKLFEKLTPNSEIFIHTVATEGYEYGTVYVPTLDWMIKNISIINKYLGQVIDINNILGWAISSFISQPKTMTFNDLTSQATYGLKPLQGAVQLKTQYLTAMSLYGKSLLKYYAEPRYNGQATFTLWDNGNQINTVYPDAGDLCNMLHYIRGNQNDIHCQQVVYNTQGDSLTCTVGASKDGKADKYLWLANQLKKLIETPAVTTDTETMMEVEVKETLTITDSYDVEVLDTTQTDIFDGEGLGRLWFA